MTAGMNFLNTLHKSIDTVDGAISELKYLCDSLEAVGNFYLAKNIRHCCGEIKQAVSGIDKAYSDDLNETVNAQWQSQGETLRLLLNKGEPSDTP